MKRDIREIDTTSIMLVSSNADAYFGTQTGMVSLNRINFSEKAV
jgi:hypothetical protein